MTVDVPSPKVEDLILCILRAHKLESELDFLGAQAELNDAISTLKDELNRVTLKREGRWS